MQGYAEADADPPCRAEVEQFLARHAAYYRSAQNHAHTRIEIVVCRIGSDGYGLRSNPHINCSFFNWISTNT
jgi:hypothetical protein